MKMYKLNYLFLFLIGFSVAAVGQEKLNKSYQVKKDVTIDIDARNTNIIIETSDRSNVEIQAYINKGVSKSAAEALLKGWQLSTSNNNSNINIFSGSATNMKWEEHMDSKSLNDALAQLPEIMGPIMNDLVNPLIQNIAKNPLPPEVFENLGNINFDYQAYKEEGDAYLERWEREVDQKFGKDLEQKIEKWAANLEKNTEQSGKNLEKSMEAWGNSFGASMEAWGESFGKNMEAWAKNFEEQMEQEHGDKASESNTTYVNRRDGKSQKTIKIKAPKNAKLRLNIRYGKVQLGSIRNISAELSHAEFQAAQISGTDTHIKAAYTPLNVENWEYGILNASFLPVCNLETVKSIKLISNSSDVNIGRLKETGILSGTFGNLKIDGVDDAFKNLDIDLENSDLVLQLPPSVFRFNYNGTQSEVSYPDDLHVEKSLSYDNQIIKGYSGSSDADAQLRISARYSNVLLK